ncbi:hypothetical protein FDP41_001736 [Naegleria fowleri]|uniref:Ornithine aminotransferase n=1 Tax=Naegleria fowleri TaxID=5763 RepID=A0A6A5BN10_NAEFO|nr:uncharacterized protein FDP41_001736 [Naegleria fowleri]KAF0979393.1 hypothetical protein FDP41_001736 [Naegleria fowleri]
MVEYKLQEPPYVPCQEQVKPPLLDQGPSNLVTTDEENITSDKDWISRDRQCVIHGHQHHVNPRDSVIFQKAFGTSYWDVNNVEYIDMMGGLHNNHVGHGREELANVAANQMKQMEFSLNVASYSHVCVIQCAEKILSIAKTELPSMDKVYFTSGGSEAVESAIHCALKYWQLQGKDSKRRIISFKNCYHGSTFISSSLNESMKEEYGLERVSKEQTSCLNVDFPHDLVINKDSHGKQHVNNGFYVAEQLENLIKQVGADNIAAFIAEPIQGSGGALEPHPDFFPLCKRICDKYGVLLIIDEVMTGFGKTGKWFAISHSNIEPDMIVFGKGVTSGYVPLGGIIISKNIFECVFKSEETFLHDYTYSGHPVCCMVALKNLEIIENEKLIQRAKAMGDQFRNILAERLRDCPLFAGTSGMGLLIGVMLKEKVSSKVEHYLSHHCHILADHCAQNDKVVIMTPPFIIEEDRLNMVANGFYDALQSVGSSQSSSSVGPSKSDE